MNKTNSDTLDYAIALSFTSEATRRADAIDASIMLDWLNNRFNGWSLAKCAEFDYLALEWIDANSAPSTGPAPGAETVGAVATNDGAPFSNINACPACKGTRVVHGGFPCDVCP
jgi:hypothetical protein